MLVFYHHMYVEHTCEREHDVHTFEAATFLFASYVKCMLVCWLNEYYNRAQKIAADQLANVSIGSKYVAIQLRARLSCKTVAALLWLPHG